jgi:N-acetylglucosaminyl-diphospho-decaprenol L-rhamnosyltransferase
MNLNLKNITFIIVTFKSEEVIYDCINSLPKNSNIIIIENSKNNNLKRELESKYDNIEVILNENIGMGASNNIGIKKASTQFVYILNPDVKFEEKTFEKLKISSEKIKDFAILSPIHNKTNFPNYKIYNNFLDQNEDIINVDTVDGFSMIINKEKFKDQNFFDENIFLFLENDDLCLRVKKNGESIYIIKDSLIEHLGASSTKVTKNNDIEYLRNWHWMWSKFYFNKKHYGYLNALIKNFPSLISSKIKFFYYFLIFNTHKKMIYKMRFKGLFSSMLGKKSLYRPKI